VPLVQLAAVAAATLAAVLAESTLGNFLALPAALITEVARTPPARLPAAALLLLLVAATYLQFRRNPTLERAWRIAASVVAIGGIVWFFRAGDLDWHGTGDWKKEWTYNSAWHEALTRGRLPWYLNEVFQTTNRFFANPETTVGPQVILLRWIPIGRYYAAVAAACMAIGVTVLHRLARELDFSPLVSLLVLALFLMNGHLIAHLGAGHLQWIACFAFPSVFLYLIRAARGDTSAQTRARLALSLMLMLVVGGWHPFVWCVIFIAAWTIADRSRWAFGAGVGAMTAGLAAFRVVPAMTVYASSHNVFLSSYPSIAILVAALVGYARDGINDLFWFEYDAFVGWVGFAIVLAGLTVPLNRSWRSAASSLWVPSATLILLSTFDIYKWTLFKLPGFVSERVATRLVIVGVLGLALIGSTELDRWVRRESNRSWRIAAVGLATAFLLLQLVLRTNLLRPAPDQGLGPAAVNVLSTQPVETSYAGSVVAGVGISLASLAVAIRQWRVG